MVCTLYGVKLELKAFDGLSDVVPDYSYDSSQGYSVGFRMLVNDGSTWVCDDASVGAAIWTQDTSRDQIIKDSCRSMTELLIEYTDNRYLTVDGEYISTGISFSAGGIIDDLFTGFDVIYQGDTIDICGSKRNDGYYDVLSASPGSLTVTPEPTVLGNEDQRILFLASNFPPALSAIASRMVAYDVGYRSVTGLDSESIGSYSYSKETVSIGGLGYPAEVVAGLMSFKRPKVR